MWLEWFVLFIVITGCVAASIGTYISYKDYRSVSEGLPHIIARRNLRAHTIRLVELVLFLAVVVVSLMNPPPADRVGLRMYMSLIISGIAFLITLNSIIDLVARRAIIRYRNGSNP